MSTFCSKSSNVISPHSEEKPESPQQFLRSYMTCPLPNIMSYHSFLCLFCLSYTGLLTIPQTCQAQSLQMLFPVQKALLQIDTYLIHSTLPELCPKSPNHQAFPDHSYQKQQPFCMSHNQFYFFFHSIHHLPAQQIFVLVIVCLPLECNSIRVKDFLVCSFLHSHELDEYLAHSRYSVNK